MDKVPYVLIGMLIGSVLSVILMALLFASKREDESLERIFKARKERKAKPSDDVGSRVAEEPVADFVEDDFNSAEEPVEVSDGVSDEVLDDGSSKIPKEPVEDASNADSVDKGAKFVKVTPKSNVFVPFPGELIEWDTYFNGKHPLDT